MYCGVPTTVPARVSLSLDSAREASMTFEMPKSRIFTSGSSSSRSHEEDVRGLEVAVDHARLVRLGEAARHLHRDAHRHVGRQALLVLRSFATSSPSGTP